MKRLASKRIIRRRWAASACDRPAEPKTGDRGLGGRRFKSRRSILVSGLRRSERSISCFRDLKIRELHPGTFPPDRFGKPGRCVLVDLYG